MRTLFVLLLSGAIALGANQPSHREARNTAHVVVVVWDGMRPDFINETNTPALCQLARDGVVFQHHHSVYPSLTNVNSTALATGVVPARSGVLGNYEYRPALDPRNFIRTDKPAIVRKGDQLTRDHYLGASTIAEMLRAAGGRSAIVGGKTTTLLHDRNATGGSVTIFSGETAPPDALGQIEKGLGPFPDREHVPGIDGDRWTMRALTEVLWAKEIPRYSELWLSEPDRTQHAIGPGVEASLDAIKSSDKNLGALLHALEEKGERQRTDIVVVSDHGFSTIGRAIDLRSLLRKAGFNVIVDGDLPAKSGEVRVVSNGGMVLFYITEHDPAVSARLAEFLQQSDFAGVLFSRSSLAGTFPLTQLHLDTAHAPDLLMSFRWNDARNQSGVPGMIDSMTTLDVAAGTHGTLSKYDLHNICIAAGPDFRRGETDELPTSNLDLAPTILHLLGIKPTQPLDGRVLREALTNESNTTPSVEAKTIEATREFPGGTWRQYLQTESIGGEIYVDEGNGELRPK